MKNFKKIVGTVLVLSFVSLGSVIAVSAENNNEKTNICHATSSQNNPWNAISISTSSLQTHLGHGDFLYTGPLKQNGTPSNDGNNWCKSHAPAQISVTKIICPTENLLPNWGSGAANITAATAPDFLLTHPTCYEQHGWKYEYAPNGTANPGNNIEVAGGAWTAFDENNLPEIQAGHKVWVREQLPSGYIPYSGATSNLGSTEAKNSAEFYCSTDVLNYDNYDSISTVEAGKLYHCVAFNVKIDVCPNLEGAQQTVPQGMHLDNEGQCVPDTATIHATKVMCDTEWDLPNWGNNGPDIGPNTATDFVAGNSSCQIVPWTFQWAPDTGNPGDNVPSAGAPWTSFGSGTVNVPAGSTVWLREEIPSAYQSFSGATSDLDGTNSKRSAEFYCNTDVLNYDNFDFISPVVANTDYYCLGFNTLKPTKADGKVHVFKYIDGVQATVENAGGVSFPMFNAPYTEYPYYLGPNSDAQAGDIPYESSTYNIVGGQTYTTQENLDTTLVGSSCSNENNPEYELVGYTTGKTFDEAKNGAPSKTVPEFVIDGDSYVIVWNHKCPPEVVDMCLNIDGIQATVPQGYHADGPNCYPDQNQCGDKTLDVVSDATNLVSGGVAGNATPIASPNPGWTNIPLVSWIWDGLTDFDGSTLQTRSFTKTFNIVGVPTAATLEVAADNSFVGNINGQGSAVIADPTEFNYGATKTYNDVLQYLVTGANTIGFDVSNFPVSGSTFDGNPAGLTYKLHITSNDCPICDSNLDLVTNGSLENGVEAGVFATLNAGDNSSITNWTVDSGSVDYIGSYWQSSNGSRNIDLNGTVAGSISQTIPTTIGNTYTVTFDMSGNPDSSEDQGISSPSLKKVQVSATGAASTEYTFDTAAKGNTKEDMKWEAKSYTFVATAASTTITFASQIAGAFGPALDNVKIVCGEVSLPNPAHITIVKNTSSSVNNGTFHFTGFGGDAGFDLTTSVGTASTLFEPTVVENTSFTIAEVVPEGWALDGVVCLYGENSVGESVTNGKTIIVDPGDHVTCTFTNHKLPTIIDMCPNIPEVQSEIPEGMHKDEGGNCVPNISVDLPQCSDGIDNGDEEDSLIDSADPGCHSDGNVNNPSSYVPSDNSESNEQSAICSDGKDNDGDELIDSNDPGCLSGPDNTWNPDDISEDNNTSSTGGGGGGGGGGGAPGVPFVPQTIGKVLGESTSCGPYLNEYMKKGSKNNKEEVKKLQTFLNDYLKLKPALPVNGIFGVQTYKAVIKFQEKENGLVLNPWVGVTLKDAKKGTGWVFKTTVWRINDIMCPELKAPLPAITLD